MEKQSIIRPRRGMRVAFKAEHSRKFGNIPATVTEIYGDGWMVGLTFDPPVVIEDTVRCYHIDALWEHVCLIDQIEPAPIRQVP